MGIGSLGFSEIIVIFVIVLVFFGPRRFPEIARSMGHAMREFRRSLNQIQRELEDADPRSSIPGREFLSDLGKPSTWLDPNKAGAGAGASTKPAQPAQPEAPADPPPRAEPPETTREAGGVPSSTMETEYDSEPEPYPRTASESGAGDPAEQLPMFEGEGDVEPEPPRGDTPSG